MSKPLKVWRDIYMVGGAGLSHPYDCSVYLVDAGELLLVDSGAGQGFERLIGNIKSLGLDPGKISTVLVTHAHIDHIGGLGYLRERFGAQIIAHEMDSEPIETGEGVGAEFYGVKYIPCPVDFRIKGSRAILPFGSCELEVIHIPGHTPGSIAACIDMADKKVLFGQDIHGPYLPEWGADPVLARRSLAELANLRADILCEGHFGIYQPAEAVEKYIRSYLESI